VDARFSGRSFVGGRDDVLTSADWCRRLVGPAADGDCVELAGAHTFRGHPSGWWELVGVRRSVARDDEVRVRTPSRGGSGRRCDVQQRSIVGGFRWFAGG
jgi:hypothetical protein